MILLIKRQIRRGGLSVQAFEFGECNLIGIWLLKVFLVGVAMLAAHER